VLNRKKSDKIGHNRKYQMSSGKHRITTVSGRHDGDH